ncbi:unnamed protein product [Nesidiocoris tenuis]|uniref:Uncharacterized protein n=1 Tax=Nesidiocoris tenuis TaxID=355587 RepID=A0A6H5GQC0_9HEMI|nr:unnamed protein product [Nesidiocoris tenuis]
MPKETSIGRQNAHHQPLTSQAYTSTQPTSAFLHQYNHLPSWLRSQRGQYGQCLRAGQRCQGPAIRGYRQRSECLTLRLQEKLASHGPEKSAPMYARNEPSRPPSTTRQTTTRDRSPLKATTSSATTSRSSSGTTSSKMSSPMAADDKYRQERHKYDSARGDYYRRSGSHRRESERSEANFERSTYEPPPTSVYDRLGVPPPTVITSSATTFDRNASAAYERRAVFDRAYEQAAYERRAYGAHFPSAVNTSSAYYSSVSIGTIIGHVNNNTTPIHSHHKHHNHLHHHHHHHNYADYHLLSEANNNNSTITNTTTNTITSTPISVLAMPV